MDSLLRTATRELRAGHQDMNIMVRGQTQTGNAYSSDWTGSAIGASHQYNCVEAEKNGKALIGNKYGGKSFWDD